MYKPCLFSTKHLLWELRVNFFDFGARRIAMAQQPKTQPPKTQPPEQGADSRPGEAAPSLKQRMGERLVTLREWIVASRVRKVAAGVLGLIALIGTFALWSYLAHLAVDAVSPVTIEMALAALDARDTDEAKNLVGQMQQGPASMESLGGALFVLGAAKGYDADKEWSVERRRVMHLVAARYLQKAQVLGPPPQHEGQLLFLLGRSLILGNQSHSGIPLLEEALKDNSLPLTEIHALLASAYLQIPDPDPDAALKHNELLLSYQLLSPEMRNKALITQVEILGSLGQVEEARESLRKVSMKDDNRARLKMLSGQLDVAEAEQMQPLAAGRNKKVSSALAKLREAQLLDPLSGEISRRAMFWIGRGYEVQGDSDAATAQYDRIGKLYGDTPEGLAATLAKADLDRKHERVEQSLASYRTVLETVGDPIAYSNPILSLSKLRKRLSKAHQAYVDAGQFEQALALVEQFQPLFNKVDVTELRAITHRQWGEKKTEEASESHRWQAGELLREGRHHYRAAGRALEDVARLRFATRQFTDDLWQAAENYSLGHSYTHASRTIKEYLHHESRRRNGLALLRLGQAKLALGQPAEAISTLTDCIELFPRDEVVFQARLECARAHMEMVQYDQAEKLLMENLAGDSLTPKSLQWRDSLFTLGHLLHDSSRYLEAITKLEEAIERYPNDSQTLLARYIIARSFHSASDEPKRKLQSAKIESERQKSRKLLADYLNQALDSYLAVQRTITLEGHGDSNAHHRTLLRNCYMMQGSLLFQLKRFEEARKAYANISTLYQHEPFVLESFVQIANCWHRLNQPVKARGTVERAKSILKQLPEDTNFKIATNLNRQEWELLLDHMGKW